MSEDFHILSVLHKIYRAAILFMFLLCGGQVALAESIGIGYSYSRLIMMASDRSASVSVKNQTDHAYLMQSNINTVDSATGLPIITMPGSRLVPFHILPPLKRLDPKAELPLRIIAMPAAIGMLPAGKESVYFISVKAIPSYLLATDGGTHQEGNLVFAMVNSIKLFYRPAGLEKEAVANISGSLNFRLDNNKLLVTNPSAYYATFSSLNVGGKDINADVFRAMVPPASEQVYVLPSEPYGSEVRWRLIDEYGMATDENYKLLK